MSLDPRIRLVLTAGALLTAALVEKHRFDRLLTLVALEGLLAAVLLGMGALRIGAFVKVAVACAVPAMLVSLFAALRPGHVLLEIAPGLTISSEGFALALGLALSALAATAAVALLASTTSSSEIRQALRALGVPEGALSALTLALGQISLAADETARTRRAALLRGDRSRGALAFAAARGRLTLLFHGCAARASRVDRTLDARGFRGVIPDPPLPPLRAADLAAGAIALAGLAALRLLP